MIRIPTHALLQEASCLEFEAAARLPSNARTRMLVDAIGADGWVSIPEGSGGCAECAVPRHPDTVAVVRIDQVIVAGRNAQVVATGNEGAPTDGSGAHRASIRFGRNGRVGTPAHQLLPRCRRWNHRSSRPPAQEHWLGWRHPSHRRRRSYDAVSAMRGSAAAPSTTALPTECACATAHAIAMVEDWCLRFDLQRAGAVAAAAAAAFERRSGG